MKKMHFILLLVVTLFSSCVNRYSDKAGEFNVRSAGSLKHIMENGDISSKIDLMDLSSMPHLYALGMLENLSGEVQIFGGVPWHSFINNGVIDYNNEFSNKACFLVYAEVVKWKSINIPAQIKDLDQFEDYLINLADSIGINTNEPFPFLITGLADFVDWHVINWNQKETNHNIETHLNNSFHDTFRKRNLKMLGFYSKSDKGKIVNDQSNMHIHVQTNDRKIAGHVNDFTLGNSMVLKLPLSE